MRAIVINGCCEAKDLHVSDIPIPEVRSGWVLVRVRAAGLNHSEVLLRTIEADYDYIHTPIVPGIECVGEVADASDSPFRQGDKVIAMMGGMGRSFNGSYAEYALLPQKNVFQVDTDWDWTTLAALPETYYTAYGSLTEGLLLTADDTLLIRGATSSVGQAAVQLAKAIGATVVATTRHASSFERLYAIGADHCLIDDGNLSRQSFQVRPNKLLELIGPKTLHDSLLTVRRTGYVCQTGLLGNVYTMQHFDPIKQIPNGVFLTGFFSNYPSQQAVDSLLDLMRRANLRPLYSQAFTLDDIAQAHAQLEAGTTGGKIILTT